MRINLAMIKFCTQAGFSLMVLLTCIYLLVSGSTDEKKQTLAWSGLTSTLTAWLPAPEHPGDNDKENKGKGKR